MGGVIEDIIRVSPVLQARKRRNARRQEARATSTAAPAASPTRAVAAPEASGGRPERGSLLGGRPAEASPARSRRKTLLGE